MPPAPGLYRVVNTMSKTCLDVVVPAGPAPEGTPVTGWAVDENKKSQVWRLTDDNVLTHVESSLKLTYDQNEDIGNRTTIIVGKIPGLWTYSPGTLDATAWTVSTNGNYFVDLAAGDATNGTTVQFWRRPGAIPLQDHWTFVEAKDGGTTPPPPTPDGVEPGTGLYRIRNSGSRTLLDHYSSSAAAGTAVQDFFDTWNPSQEWLLVKDGTGLFTIRNNLTEFYLNSGAEGAAVTAGLTQQKWTIEKSTAPVGSKSLPGYLIKPQGSTLVVQETVGVPQDGNGGKPLAVALAKVDQTIKQRWFFTVVSEDEKYPIADNTSAQIRAIQSNLVMTLSDDTRVIGTEEGLYADRQKWSFKLNRTDSEGSYDIQSLRPKYTDLFLFWGPKNDDPTVNVSYAQGAEKQWLKRGWILRKRPDQTISLTPRGWNQQMAITSGPPLAKIGMTAVSGDLVYAPRWSVETVT